MINYKGGKCKSKAFGYFSSLNSGFTKWKRIIKDKKSASNPTVKKTCPVHQKTMIRHHLH